MRHKMVGRKLNRTKSHRRALFSNMVNALIEHEQIETTLPKAKDLRSFAEKMITLGKKSTLAARRQAFAFMRNDELVAKLFETLAKRYEKRNGGYTRVLKAGFRYGDMAPLAIIEFVDRDESAKGLKDKKRVADAKPVEDKKIEDKKIESKPVKEAGAKAVQKKESVKAPKSGSSTITRKVQNKGG